MRCLKTIKNYTNQFVKNKTVEEAENDVVDVISRMTKNDVLDVVFYIDYLVEDKYDKIPAYIIDIVSLLTPHQLGGLYIHSQAPNEDIRRVKILSYQTVEL